jgi:hypothetical protein
MSSEERKRSEVMVRLKKGSLRLQNAAGILGISYRQTRGVWKRFQRQGAKGLVHGGVGRKSNRAKSKKLRDRVLQLIRQKYAGEVGERFGPTLASESGGARRTGRGGGGSRILGSWCGWMAVLKIGWRAEGPMAA